MESDAKTDDLAKFNLWLEWKARQPPTKPINIPKRKKQIITIIIKDQADNSDSDQEPIMDTD